jgi:hypothetical protein
LRMISPFTFPGSLDDFDFAVAEPRPAPCTGRRLLPGCGHRRQKARRRVLQNCCALAILYSTWLDAVEPFRLRLGRAGLTTLAQQVLEQATDAVEEAALGQGVLLGRFEDFGLGKAWGYSSRRGAGGPPGGRGRPAWLRGVGPGLTNPTGPGG